MSYATRSRQNSISSPEEIYMAHEDNDVKKGAVESETRDQHSQTSLEGQLAHRTEDARIKGRDTDGVEAIASLQMEMSGGILATPAIVDGNIFVRTDSHLYVFGN